MILLNKSYVLAFFCLISTLNVSLGCFSSSGSSSSGGSSALNDITCPASRQLNGSSQSKIVGGTEAPVGLYTSIAYISDGSSLCAATLINTEWLVTAAHCDFNLASWFAVLGQHNIRVTEASSVRRDVVQRVVVN